MMDLAIQFKEKSSQCLYQQIYEYIRDEIRKGKLSAGEKLPSTRLLAENLQVARSTIDAAYGQLVAEGYVEAVSCRVYFVSHVEELFQFPREEREKSPAETGEPETRQNVLYDFSPHAVSLKDFPFATWKKITKNILVDANSEIDRKSVV